MNKQAFNLSEIFKKAQQKTTLELANLNGRYGPYTAYIIKGNSFQIKDRLKALGFKWNRNSGGWIMSQKKMNNSVKEGLRRLGVEIEGEIPQQPEPVQPVEEQPTTEQPVKEPQETIYNMTNPSYRGGGEWETEEEAGYSGRFKCKFPLNKNIAVFDMEYVYNESQKYPIKGTVDRTYFEGKGASNYNMVVKKGFNATPKY